MQSDAAMKFNFGITIDHIRYSATNSRFESCFVGLDDVAREKRSFSMLEIKQAALYWNTGVNRNWTEDNEFLRSSVSAYINNSNFEVSELRRKYEQSAANVKSSVYMIQPFDITVKFRSNKDQAS